MIIEFTRADNISQLNLFYSKDKFLSQFCISLSLFELNQQ